MKLKLIKALIWWLNKKHPYLLLEAVVPEGSHVQRNGKRKKVREASTTMNTDGVEVAE
jgi:hypothetical protein